eukprot:CAMPEP_0116884694 /NCGR_PEP_ID=MMETSP0463-20121206/17686_1 /TAXON_ID=181622 /ORGANISM="Strombidinopsis sp, Strain SopsisLIS2011" /LENGTH=56 /DNA_ID=CAMNT_0004541655 /DNA_START=103 /DNA_END=273 /DNA_ORIENTATION=-
MTSFEKRKMVLQLSFENVFDVSTKSDDPEYLRIDFVNNTMFKDSEDGLSVKENHRL